MNFSINNKIFSHINQSPHVLSLDGVSLVYGRCSAPYLGFVLPRSLGHATKRNLFKRRCREIFYQTIVSSGIGPIGIIIKTNNVGKSYGDLKSLFFSLLKNLTDNDVLKGV